MKFGMVMGLALAGMSAMVMAADDCAAYNKLAAEHFNYAATLKENPSAVKLMGEPGWPIDFRGELFKKPPRNIEDLKGKVESVWSRVDIGTTDYFVTTLPAKEDVTPWHDILAHGKMVMMAGGPDYGEDGYFCAAAIGGRIPFYPKPQDSTRTLRTKWMMFELAEDLNLGRFIGFWFEGSLLRQHALYRGGTDVYANRGEDDWEVAGVTLPSDGFIAKNADREVAVVKVNGKRRAYARSAKEKRLFVDARQGGEFDFGGIVTSGALMFDFMDEWYWSAEALSGEGEFTAVIDMVPFRTSARPVERVTGAKNWKIDGDKLVLTFAEGARKIGICFKEPVRRPLQEEIDAATAKGGGTVVVPPGEWESAPIVLKDNVTLRLEEGATLYASTNIAEYAAGRGERVFLYADHAKNIAIEGKGTLDGRGYKFRESIPLEGASQPQDLPVLIRFSRCENIRMEDFFYTRSGAWGCHLRNNNGVTVRRVRCFNHNNKTNDGIDIESSNVLIEDSNFDADDDSLVIKTESDINFPVTNIVVRNCRLATTCNGLKAGSGSYCTVKDVLMENCRIVRPGKDWRFRWYDYIPGVTNRVTCNTAINFSVVDGGRLENLTVRNVTFEGVRVPISFRLSRRHENSDGLPVYMKNVLIENVKGSCDSIIPSQITGVPGLRPENFVLRNVEITTPGGGLATNRPVPENERGFPGPWMLCEDEGGLRPYADCLNAYGFYIRHVDGVVFDNVKVRSVIPDARPALYTEDCTRVDASGLATNGK